MVNCFNNFLYSEMLPRAYLTIWLRLCNVVGQQDGRTLVRSCSKWSKKTNSFEVFWSFNWWSSFPIHLPFVFCPLLVCSPSNLCLFTDGVKSITEKTDQSSSPSTSDLGRGLRTGAVPVLDPLCRSLSIYMTQSHSARAPRETKIHVGWNVKKLT